MPQLDTILVKTASRCNLDCSYCYVYQGEDSTWQLQPKKMSEETINSIVSNIIEISKLQTQGIAIVIHGGEPLLVGYNRLKKLFQGLRDSLSHEKYPISIQTNGTLINERLLDLCSQFKVSISVSIDGIKKANDIARFNHKGESSFDKVVNGIKLLANHHDFEFMFAGTLSVIQPSISPKETYSFLKSLGTPNIDFLFQDGNHDKLPIGKESFYSQEYGEWLSEILFLYLLDDSPPKIRVLDDLIKIILGGEPSKEGKGSHEFGIIILETDGEIRKNDTLRASFEGADFFLDRPNINNIKLIDLINSKEFNNYIKTPEPSSKECSSCDILNICGGGMPLYRWSNSNKYNNPSVYCNDHKLLINNLLNILSKEGVVVG